MSGRLARWAGLLGIGWRRIHHRVTTPGHRQTILSVLGVGCAVTLLLLLASVSVGLTTDPAASPDGDYWVVPEGASSAVTDVDDARLGGVHEVAEGLTNRQDVRHASPMLIEFLQLEGPTGERGYVLVIGVVPSPNHDRIAPLSTTGLQAGDPYYNVGGYNGTWTGEVIVSESTTTELGVERGETMSLQQSDRTFTVSRVAEPEGAGLTQLPIALVHLSELQELTGASTDDTANQIVVVANEPTPATKTELEGLYPHTTVKTRGGLLSASGSDSRLPSAMGIAAVLIGVISAVLLISTSFGFELAADRERRNLMSAVGVSTRSQAGLVGVETLVIALYGAGLGTGGWLLGIGVINAVSTHRYGVAVAAFDPRFIVYGVAIAVIIGGLSLPYLLLVDRRALRISSVTHD